MIPCEALLDEASSFEAETVAQFRHLDVVTSDCVDRRHRLAVTPVIGGNLMNSVEKQVKM